MRPKTSAFAAKTKEDRKGRAAVQVGNRPDQRAGIPFTRGQGRTKGAHRPFGRRRELRRTARTGCIIRIRAKSLFKTKVHDLQRFGGKSHRGRHQTNRQKHEHVHYSLFSSLGGVRRSSPAETGPITAIRAASGLTSRISRVHLLRSRTRETPIGGRDKCTFPSSAIVAGSPTSQPTIRQGPPATETSASRGLSVRLQASR